MASIAFEVRGEAMGQPRPRFTTAGGHAKAYEPKSAKEYKAYVKLLYLEAVRNERRELKGPREGTGYMVAITVQKTPPKSYSKKRTAAALAGLLQPVTKPDLDNVAKIMLDALNGLAWRDDSEITNLTVSKAFGAYSCARIQITWDEDKGETR